MNNKSEENHYIIPSEYRLAGSDIEITVGRKKTKLRVSNVQL